MFTTGTPVIFRKVKRSTHPGPRAHHVRPAPLGDTYTYCVDKLWVVAEVLEDNRLLLCTRRGKTHVVDAADPNLRRARWWERLLYRHRIPRLSRSLSSGNTA